MEPRNLQISQQEHEALALAGLGDKAKKEQPFDPQRGLRQSQDDLRTIRKIHAEVASATTASLSARLKTRVNFELDAEIAAITFSALKEAMAASGTSCINVLDVAPFGKGLLTLDLPTCFRFIDRCLGGSGRAAVPERTFFTDVEMITLDEVVNLILSGFQRSWSKVLPEFANKLLQREMDPYVLNLQWTPTERILSSTFNIVSDIVTGEMKICLPYSPVASHLPKPGSAVFSQTSGNTSVPMLEKRLQKVPLDVRAILGRTEIPVRDLLRLKVGDLVRLDNSVGDPIYLQVEGQTKFSARLGLVGKKCGLKIESQIREIEE
jgi:flagellar motor switch protein FliM